MSKATSAAVNCVSRLSELDSHAACYALMFADPAQYLRKGINGTDAAPSKFTEAVVCFLMKCAPSVRWTAPIPDFQRPCSWRVFATAWGSLRNALRIDFSLRG